MSEIIYDYTYELIVKGHEFNPKTVCMASLIANAVGLNHLKITYDKDDSEPISITLNHCKYPDFEYIWKDFKQAVSSDELGVSWFKQNVIDNCDNLFYYTVMFNQALDESSSVEELFKRAVEVGVPIIRRCIFKANLLAELQNK